jgi:fucose permease
VTTVQVAPSVLRARTAVVVTFGTSGVAFASFASRTPAVREALGLTTAQLGLLLLCMSAGSIAGLPLSGPIVHRFGTARGVLGGSLTLGIGLGFTALGLVTGVVLPAVAGLVLVGLGIGVWDVSMNVEGADVERRLGRSLMPRLHAAFSMGTVAGAGIGTATAAAGVPIAAQVAAIRVSVVSSIGYTAFLAGPPLIGVLAQLDGILIALFVVVGALVLGLLVSGATRPLNPGG